MVNIKTGFLASAGITVGALTLGKLIGDYDSVWQIAEYMRNGPLNYDASYFNYILSPVAHKAALVGSALTAATGAMAGLEHLWGGK